METKFLRTSGVRLAWLAEPEGWRPEAHALWARADETLVVPKARVADPDTGLAGTEACLIGPETWRTGPEASLLILRPG